MGLKRLTQASGLPAKNAEADIAALPMKNPEPTEELARSCTNQRFHDYVPLSRGVPDEGKMLSLEDPYPCRFRPKASLSMKT